MFSTKTLEMSRLEPHVRSLSLCRLFRLGMCIRMVCCAGCTSITFCLPRGITINAVLSLLQEYRLHQTWGVCPKVYWEACDVLRANILSIKMLKHYLPHHMWEVCPNVRRAWIDVLEAKIFSIKSLQKRTRSHHVLCLSVCSKNYQYRHCICQKGTEELVMVRGCCVCRQKRAEDTWCPQSHHLLIGLSKWAIINHVFLFLPPALESSINIYTLY